MAGGRLRSAALTIVSRHRPAWSDGEGASGHGGRKSRAGQRDRSRHSPLQHSGVVRGVGGGGGSGVDCKCYFGALITGPKYGPLSAST